jgi:hypothetical protein
MVSWRECLFWSNSETGCGILIETGSERCSCCFQSLSCIRVLCTALSELQLPGDTTQRRFFPGFGCLAEGRIPTRI